MLTIDLLRHGALKGGLKYRGLTDDPLTQAGRRDMETVWQQLSSEVDLIITSPLSRCANPAAEWAKQRAIPCIIEPRIAEMHYGRWEGKTSDQIKREYPGMLEMWRRDPSNMRPPAGESIHELRLRLQMWMQEISLGYKGKHLLLVSHSGVLRMLIALALQAPIISTRQLAMPYCCWSRICYTDQTYTLAFHQHSQ
ncbi:MAG: histidine phosphatase family protein [Mariprofundus sp.]|nr:histidine phosphatase family protein [Mariprofundus sp.]